MSNKKICICFFGLTRSLKKTINSIKNNIFKELSNNNFHYDIYLHTYYLNVLTNVRTKEYNCKLDNNEYKILKLNKFIIENQNNFDKTINLNLYKKHGDPWNDNFKSLKNLIRQLNSLKQVTKLWRNSGKKYDIVLYLRPDLLYINKFPIFQLNELLKNKKKNIIYTPKWCSFGWGLNDRIAFGLPYVMNIYGNRYDEAINYSKKYKLHSEKFLKYVIIYKNKIENKNLLLFGKRIRANGNIINENFN